MSKFLGLISVPSLSKLDPEPWLRLFSLSHSESDPHKPRHFWFQVPCLSHQLGSVEELYLNSCMISSNIFDYPEKISGGMKLSRSKVLDISTLNNRLHPSF
ncbi:hypothetical protein Bca4012_025847 [Brassica carinata]|uniref:Uncharacterized protein n=1 Tax=Brassica carinata TaxID=52824 RepID=A0A8X8AU45_BRACI|nr:hypothetical protein Bca52824_023085 [Brassica carinata]